MCSLLNTLHDLKVGEFAIEVEREKETARILAEDVQGEGSFRFTVCDFFAPITQELTKF